jgi:hypothetical protein
MRRKKSYMRVFYHLCYHSEFMASPQYNTKSKRKQKCVIIGQFYRTDKDKDLFIKLILQ